jgi:hypothetical protein
MAHEWVFDVLTDLKLYATKNRLTALHAQLDQAALVAAVEIASAEGKGPLAAITDGTGLRSSHRNNPAGRHAR